MNPLTIALIIVLVVLIAGLVALYFFGKKAQKRQEEQQVQLEANKQYVSMLIIDKKRLKMKESGLPQMVIDQTPKYLRRSKVPVVKAKIGPQMATLMCDERIFASLPLKKEVKAAISGIYIMEVKALHGKLPATAPVKKNWWKRQVEKLQEKAGAKPL
ncbi:MAG: hypothetical protein R3Y47_06940 [Lachnospiraceae bacterium]